MTAPIIPHSRPLIHPADIEAVTAVLRSGMIAGASSTEPFEAAVARTIGRRHAVAVSSGTAALYAVLTALGVGPGDEVVVPAYVCSSLLYAARMAGAVPVCADAGADGFHVDAATVRAALGPRTKAVVIAHLFGAARPINDIIALGVPVVEDIALSFGAGRDGARAGALGSVAAVCSFYATKVLAAGEGGMVLTDDDAIGGRVRDMVHYADRPDDAMRFNFAMSGLSAALGLSQLAYLDSMLDRRRALAERYTAALDAAPLILPCEETGERHGFYRYVVRHDDVPALRDALHARGVMAERPVFAPLSRWPGMTRPAPRAEQAWLTSLSLPLYPALTDDEAHRVVAAVRAALA